MSLIMTTPIVGGLQSPFVSTVEGLDTPNSHIVGDSHAIRGQAPRNALEFEQLRNLGIESVVIFKKQTKNEVDKEIQILEELGIDYTHIEYPWKDITDFKPVCEMTLKGLKILKANNELGRNTFFHCTVGEDRTGVLAGLFLQVLEADFDVKKIFQEEMCAKGYGAGNSKKIAKVYNEVHANLNPVFLKMSYLLKKVNNDLKRVNCAYQFDKDQSFLKSQYARPESFRCTK